MRRIVIWVTGTIAGLMLLFSYHTSTQGQMLTTATAKGAAAAGVVSSPAGGSAAPTTAVPPTTAAPPGPDPTSAGPAAGPPAPGHVPATHAPTTPVPTTAAPSKDMLVNGQAYQTRWGVVQVQVTIRNGHIADVTPLSLTAGNRHDQAVNAYAVPILRQQAIDTNSANLDTISGATITSTGYIMSLQSALDAANLHK